MIAQTIKSAALPEQKLPLLHCPQRCLLLVKNSPAHTQRNDGAVMQADQLQYMNNLTCQTCVADEYVFTAVQARVWQAHKCCQGPRG